MRVSRDGIVWIALAVLALTSLRAASVRARGVRAAADSTSSVRVDLGFDTTEPGGEALVPIVLGVPDGISVGQTVTAITFPNGVLSFDQVKAGVSADVAAASIHSEVTPHPERADLSVVTVTVKSGGKPIPAGVLASVVFRVAADAEPGKPVKLGNAPHAYSAGRDPRPVSPVTGEDGEVRIEAVAAIACFFYMH